MNNAVAINARILTSINSFFFHNNSGCNPMERKKGYPVNSRGALDSDNTESIQYYEYWIYQINSWLIVE